MNEADTRQEQPRPDLPAHERAEKMVVPSDLAGIRLDLFLCRRKPEYSRALVQKTIVNQDVLVNGNPVKPSHHVHEGDLVTVRWPVPEASPPTPEAVPFEVIAEDSDLLVVNKPAGVVVHPTRTHKHTTLVHGLLHYDPVTFTAMMDSDMRPGIVHRLDKETSGAMVVAKNQESWLFLKAEFKQRKVEKTYLAIVSGELSTAAGCIENLIGRHPRHRKQMSVVEENGKLARTRYRVLARGSGASLLEVHIETGRTHQIRVHFADLNHPVLGDRLYGRRNQEVPIKPERQMLHAWRLTIPHPRTGAMREYEAPIADDFYAVMQKLKLI